MPARELIVSVVLFSLRDDQLQVLLTEHGSAWELPAASVSGSEPLEETANRTIARLLDRRKTYLEQLYTYGGQTSVMVAYFAILPAGAHLTSDTSGWQPADHLPPLASGHDEVIAYALRRLRYKLEYSAVGFQLLPEEFSMSELQHTYEIILGERLDKRNFRRRMFQSGIIEETLRQRTGEGRPARLYRYRPDAVAEVKARRLFP